MKRIVLELWNSLSNHPVKDVVITMPDGRRLVFPTGSISVSPELLTQERKDPK